MLIAVLHLALLGLLLAAPEVDELQAVLKKYAKLPYEQRHRERAIRDLGRLGTPDSTRTLEAMLVDPFAHLRDEAVSALIRLKRRPAEARAPSIALLGELLGRRTQPETRRHLATALGLIGDRGAVPALVDALAGVKDRETVEAVAVALSRLGDDRGAEALEEKARSFPAGRPACLRALGWFANAGDVALAYRKDPDDAVRAAVVDVCARRKLPVLPQLEVDDTTGEQTGIALADALHLVQDAALARRRAAALLRHRSWRVRAAAITGVEKLRDPTLLGDLVDRLEKEDGRLRYAAWNSLRRMTGKDIPPDASAWRRILPLGELPDAREMERGRPEATTAYYGLPVVSKRLAFVFDVSGSMRDEDKIGMARSRFRATASKLAKDQRYDLFVYRYYLEYPPRPRLERCFEKLTGGRARKASAWLRKQEAKGAGAIYDALVAAMMDPEVDTIYLLSDGVPSFGTVTRDYRIHQEIRKRNRWRRVVIHTILLGARGTDRAFMKRLATDSGGVAVDADGRRLR
jgi:HEAT repeat protein